MRLQNSNISMQPERWQGWRAGRKFATLRHHLPRPAHQRDPERVHGVTFAGLNVRFRVVDGVLHVVEVMPIDQ